MYNYRVWLVASPNTYDAHLADSHFIRDCGTLVLSRKVERETMLDHYYELVAAFGRNSWVRVTREAV